MDWQAWSRQFWIAMKTEGGNWKHRYQTFPNGGTVLEEVAVVDGRGVLLRWLSEERGMVVLRAQPFGEPEDQLRGEQIPVLVQGDPVASAAHVSRRLASLGAVS
jgi:hypothetical protein